MGVVDRLTAAWKGFKDAPVNQAIVNQGEIALFDPYHLFPKTGFHQYNPSILVTKKGLRIFDEMKKDDQIKAALEFKKHAALASGWEIVSPEGKPDDWEVTVFVKETLDEIDQTLDDVLFEVLTALDYGYSITEKIYEDRDGKACLCSVKGRRPHEIDFSVDEYGNIHDDGIVQWQLSKQVRMPLDKFIVYSHQKEFSNHYGRSDLEACYRAWWSKDNSYKWLNMLLERLGIPPIFFLYNSQKYTPKQIDDMKTIVQNLQAATSGVIPRATKDDLDFWAPELADQATSVFIPALNMFNKDIARAILMPGLLGVTPDDQQKGGSYARAKKHFDVFMLVVERLRKRLECLVMKEQVIKQLVDLNFTGNEYPIFKFLPLDDEVQVELLTAWGTLTGQRVVTPQGEDETHIRELMKFPELQKEPISDQPPPAPINPAGKPQDPNTNPQDQNNQSYGLIRRPNKYERQVNFAQVEATLDKVESQAIENIKSALTTSKAKLIARVQKSFTGNPRFANDLSLNGFGDVQAAIKEFLRSAYQEGSKALRQELKNKNFADPMFAPIEALRYLDQKTIWITGVLRDRITADAKLIILNAIKFGESLTATIQKLDELFLRYLGDEQVLQDGEVLSPDRLETIVRTNSTEAYNQGRLIQARDSELEGLIKYMEYSAIIDSRTTPICRLLDGKVIPLNDPNMDRLAPANHYNCRSILVAVPLSQQVNAADFLTAAEEGEALGLIQAGFSVQEKESRPAKIFRGEPEKKKDPTINVDVHMPEQPAPIVHVHIDKSATVKEVTERDKDGLIKTWVERPLDG